VTIAELRSILLAGERKTWGVQDATTCHIGAILRGMVKECDDIIDGQEQQPTKDR
jgi:hypothetical protein